MALINDVTLRDGHQSLLATRLRIEDIVKVAPYADEVGFHALEVWGGATFDVAIRFKGENPWENLRRIKKAAPRTPLMMLLRGQSLVGYKNYPDDVVRAFIQCAAEAGISIFRVFDALNYTPNLQSCIAEINSLKKERGLSLTAEATLCYTISPVHTTGHYLEKADELAAMGCDRLCIKDMAGLLVPDRAVELIRALKDQTGLPVTLHMHATMGLSDSVILAALDAGVDLIDTASRGMGGGPGHSAGATIYEIVGDKKEQLEKDQAAAGAGAAKEKSAVCLEGFDYNAALEMDKVVRALRPKYTRWESRHDRDRVEKLMSAQIPGGMLSNFEARVRNQFGPMGIDSNEAMEKILEEIPIVRRELGWPPLVTPASQIVGVQAVLNVMKEYELKKNETGAKIENSAPETRYQVLPEGTIKLLLGELGQTPAPAEPWLLDKACAVAGRKPITGRPADQIDSGLKKASCLLRERMQKNTIPMEDVLIVALWGDLGISFLENESCPEKMTGYETPPVMSDMFALEPGYEIEGVPLLGPGNISKIVSVDRIEYIAQSMLELTKLKDGTWKYLDPLLKEKRIARVHKRIELELYSARQAILEKVTDKAQCMGALRLFNEIVASRCHKIGVTLPFPELNPAG